MKPEFQDLVVHDVKREATNVLSFDVRHPDGASLPAFTAGGHLDIKLPNGLVRSYSLVNSQDDTHRYVIAVHKDAASRGGSQFMHDHLGPGAAVAVDPARRTVTFTLPAGSLGPAEALAGLRLHITTWDFDGGYRALGAQPGGHTVGGGDPAGPKVMDAMTVVLP